MSVVSQVRVKSSLRSTRGQMGEGGAHCDMARTSCSEVHSRLLASFEQTGPCKSYTYYRQSILRHQFVSTKEATMNDRKICKVNTKNAEKRKQELNVLLGLPRCKNLTRSSLFVSFCFAVRYCLKCFCFLCFTSSVSFTGSYTEVKPYF